MIRPIAREDIEKRVADALSTRPADRQPLLDIIERELLEIQLSSTPDMDAIAVRIAARAALRESLGLPPL